jgi:hypothetical protein
VLYQMIRECFDRKLQLTAPLPVAPRCDKYLLDNALQLTA